MGNRIREFVSVASPIEGLVCIRELLLSLDHHMCSYELECVFL